MKKKKKGFTLTELIAVIVILALILLIGIPAYNSIRKRTLETQYENTVKLIETAAAKYASLSGHSVALVQELIDASLIETDDGSNILDPRDKSSLNCYPVEIEYKKGKYKATFIDKKVDSCKGEDARAKYGDISIEIIGTTIFGRKIKINSGVWTSLNVTLNVKFNDDELASQEGLKYSWVSSGGQTSSEETIEISTNSIFNGTANVQVTDNEGNRYFASTNVKIDKETPIIDDINISGGNDWTKGREVTIKATDKNGSGIAGYYLGTESCNSSSEFKSTNKGSYTFKVDGSDINAAKPNEDTPATYYICVKDKVGNISENKQIKLDLKDKTAPTCKWSGEATSNTNWATSRKITLTCEDSESGCHTEYDKYTATFNDANSVVTTAKLSYVIKDNAGNSTTCEKTVDVYVDKVPPTCNWSGEATSNTNWATSRNITLTCNDANSGCEGVYTSADLSNGNSPSSSKTLRYTSTKSTDAVSGYYIYDNAGNETECKKQLAVYVDTTAPTVPNIQLVYENGSTYNQDWTNQNVITRPSSTDSEVGGVYYQYGHNGTDFYNFANGAENWLVNGGPSWKIWWEGSWNFYVRACDELGNCSNSAPAYWLGIDKSGANISFGTDGSTSNVGTASTIVTATDSYSGVSSIKYGWSTSSTSTGATTATTSGSTLSSTCNYSGSTGDCYLYIYACDTAGNCSSARTKAFKIDRKAPSVDSVKIKCSTAAVGTPQAKIIIDASDETLNIVAPGGGYYYFDAKTPYALPAWPGNNDNIYAEFGYLSSTSVYNLRGVTIYDGVWNGYTFSADCSKSGIYSNSVCTTQVNNCTYWAGTV